MLALSGCSLERGDWPGLKAWVVAGKKPKKSPAQRKAERARQKAKRAASNVGIHKNLVKKHRKNGSVSSNDKNNVFISVGSVRNIHRPSLNKIYPGGLCEAALCSHKSGDARFLVCDCEGTLSHNLPEVTGEDDTKNWPRVLKLSKRAMEE